MIGKAAETSDAFTPMSRPIVETVDGDLVDQDVDAIVNAWNRNIIPWWLLLPTGCLEGDQATRGHQPVR